MPAKSTDPNALATQVLRALPEEVVHQLVELERRGQLEPALRQAFADAAVRTAASAAVAGVIQAELSNLLRSLARPAAGSYQIKMLTGGTDVVRAVQTRRAVAASDRPAAVA